MIEPTDETEDWEDALRSVPGRRIGTGGEAPPPAPVEEELQVVLETPVVIGDDTRLVEVTLTDRDNMGFRMLLGRTALLGDFLIDPGRSYLAGRRPKGILRPAGSRKD